MSRLVRTEATPNLQAVLAQEQSATRNLAVPAVKRARVDEASSSSLTPASGEEGSALVFSEESNPPTAENVESKRKWDGKKEKSLATVLAQCKEGSFFKMTDSSNFSDVWFLPLSVKRTGSKTVLNVTCAIVINGCSLILHDHMYKIFAEDLLKMIFMATRFRHLLSGKSFLFDFESWRAQEQEHFLSGGDVVRGDQSDAAFAEYLFTRDNFRRVGLGRALSPFAYVFRKTNQHVYVSDIVGGAAMPTVYGSIDNDNLIQCTASRGTYSYSLECRLLWVGKIESEEEDVPSSQPF